MGCWPQAIPRARYGRLDRELAGPRGWAKGAGSARGWFGAAEVAFEAVDDTLVAGDLGGPGALVGVVAQDVDVGELVGDRGGELRSSGEDGAGLTDVGVGAGLSDEVAGAVAVRDTGLEHLGVEPLDPIGDRRGSGRGDRQQLPHLADGLVVGAPQRGRGEPGVTDGHLGAAMPEQGHQGLQ